MENKRTALKGVENFQCVYVSFGPPRLLEILRGCRLEENKVIAVWKNPRNCSVEVHAGREPNLSNVADKYMKTIREVCE